MQFSVYSDTYSCTSFTIVGSRIDTCIALRQSGLYELR